MLSLRLSSVTLVPYCTVRARATAVASVDDHDRKACKVQTIIVCDGRKEACLFLRGLAFRRDRDEKKLYLAWSGVSVPHVSNASVARIKANFLMRVITGLNLTTIFDISWNLTAVGTTVQYTCDIMRFPVGIAQRDHQSCFAPSLQSRNALNF